MFTGHLSRYSYKTWKTVRSEGTMVSKLDEGLPSGKLKPPPKSCIPSRAKMKTKRVRSRRSDRMELMAFMSAITRLRRFVQYLVILNTLESKPC